MVTRWSLPSLPVATPTGWDVLQAILLQLAHLVCCCLMGLPFSPQAPPGLAAVGARITLCPTARPTMPPDLLCCASPSSRGKKDGRA